MKDQGLQLSSFSHNFNILCFHCPPQVLTPSQDLDFCINYWLTFPTLLNQCSPDLISYINSKGIILLQPQTIPN